MLNLVWKDFYIQKLLMLLYIGIFGLYLFIDIHISMAIVFVSSMYVINSHFYDEKGSTNMLLNSLPYTRKQIVASKYVGSLVFTTLAVLFVLGLNFITQFIPRISVDKMTLEVVLISYLLVMIFTSFYLPFFYKFSKELLLAGFSILFLTFMLLARRFLDFVSTNFPEAINYFQSLPNYELNIMLTVFSIVCFTLSWLLSNKVYGNKDF